MKVDIIEEAGHEWALYGMALSYKDRKLNPEDWWTSQRAKAEKRAVILAGKDGGHNKFLESICVWLDIEAPRAWWSEMDTYRVGTTKQSECFSEDTEVLTDRGWMKFADVPDDAKFATLNTKLNTIEYQPSINRFNEFYEGEMIHFKNRKVDMLVTPNHRVLCATSPSNAAKFSLAGDLKGRILIPKTGALKGGSEPENFIIPALSSNWNTGSRDCTISWPEKKVKMSDWLWFLGFWIAEGSTSKDKRNYNVTLVQNEDSPATKMVDENLAALGFYAHRQVVNVSKTGVRRLRWTISNKQLFEHLVNIGDTYTKHIPEYVFSLSARLQAEMFKGMFAGDGTKLSGVYATASKQLADDTQRLLRNTGVTANIYFRKDARSRVGGIYTVNQQESSHHYIPESDRSKVQYSGRIVCAEVENGTLYVRRNGRAIWSGNSTMHTLSKRPPERDDFEEGTDDYQIQGFIVLWEQVKSDIHRLKMNLPEGFLQRRVVCTNYKVLRNIIGQREGHRLKLWQTFIDEVLAQAEHPEYLK